MVKWQYLIIFTKVQQENIFIYSAQNENAFKRLCTPDRTESSAFHGRLSPSRSNYEWNSRARKRQRRTIQRTNRQKRLNRRQGLALNIAPCTRFEYENGANLNASITTKRLGVDSAQIFQINPFDKLEFFKINLQFEKMYF